MKLSDLPAVKWVLAWGKNTPGSNIRTIPTTTSTPGFASQDQGFPPLNAVPVAGGGVPPFIQDANGALQFNSAWVIWLTAGGAFIPYDSAYQALIGGYPKGSVVQSATTFGQLWVCLADDNGTNPDAGGANWQGWSLFGWSTGDVKASYKTTADPGWVLMNDGSVGDATSGSTTRASADTQPLFSLMYNNMTDANAPILTSGGGPTTRGAQGTATAAFNAHCRLVLPKMLGRALISAGTGSGLTARPLGVNLGEESHLMTVNELVAHTHPLSNNTNIMDNTGAGGVYQGGAAGLTHTLVVGNNTTTGQPFNVMQPSSAINFMAKL